MKLRFTGALSLLLAAVFVLLSIGYGTISAQPPIRSTTDHPRIYFDAAQVAALAVEHQAGLILVGQSFDEDGNPNAAGRSAARFAEALRAQTDIPVQMWDESLSTHDARASRLALGVSRKKRAGHHDAIAATVILQSYLEEASR